MAAPRATQTLRQLFAGDATRIMQTTLGRLPTRQATRTLTTTTTTPIRSSQPLRSSWRRANPHFQRRAAHSEPPFPKAKYQAPVAPAKSLSERMKEMSKKYGWTVVGIYLSLSALDFPFCFLAVRWFGPERIAHLEHVIVDSVWRALESVVPSLKEKREKNAALAAAEGKEEDLVGMGSASLTKIKEDAEGKKQGASIWTQLLLAYGVHKSLFFIRIPVTLAITPRVVKTLRSWGWNIGKVTPK